MGCENIFSDNFVEHLKRYIGETVTIFTTSGGQSGQGFTGVVLAVNDCFVRLITRIGASRLRFQVVQQPRAQRCMNGTSTGSTASFRSVADI